MIFNSVGLWDRLPLVGQRDGEPPLSSDVYQTLRKPGGFERVAQKDETRRRRVFTCLLRQWWEK